MWPRARRRCSAQQSPWAQGLARRPHPAWPRARRCPRRRRGGVASMCALRCRRVRGGQQAAGSAKSRGWNGAPGAAPVRPTHCRRARRQWFSAARCPAAPRAAGKQALMPPGRLPPLAPPPHHHRRPRCARPAACHGLATRYASAHQQQGRGACPHAASCAPPAARAEHATHPALCLGHPQEGRTRAAAQERQARHAVWALQQASRWPDPAQSADSPARHCCRAPPHPCAHCPGAHQHRRCQPAVRCQAH